MDAYDGLNRLLDTCDFASDTEIATRFQKYLSMLVKWNASVKLTASTEWDLLSPMFEEAVWAVKSYPDREAIHMDIGSGAGFPALLMRILRKGMRLHLVESQYKRALFLEHVIRELGLENCSVEKERLDSCIDSFPQNTYFDYISWKAIRLNNRDLSSLLRVASPTTQFWIFHGKMLPVVDESWTNQWLLLKRRESFPRKKDWKLSIYIPCLSEESL